jgi:hypothetical protein
MIVSSNFQILKEIVFSVQFLLLMSLSNSVLAQESMMPEISANYLSKLIDVAKSNYDH